MKSDIETLTRIIELSVPKVAVTDRSLGALDEAFRTEAIKQSRKEWSLFYGNPTELLKSLLCEYNQRTFYNYVPTWREYK